MTKKELKRLNKTISAALKHARPPENLTVSEWADRYRYLSPESSAEAGLWRTARTPYLREPMDAFTDPNVRRIVVVSSSQMGKSEFILNAIGYIIDQDPGSTLYIQPTVEDSKKFSNLRISPMIRDCPKLRGKVHNAKGRDAKNTTLQKAFPGGMLTLVGTNSPSGLASTPVRYVLADERDRFAESAGKEGDPFELALARQATFYNAKAVEVSTPTVKDASPIAESFYLGTQETWRHKCPHCGEYFLINFDALRFTPKQTTVGKKNFWTVTDIGTVCPHCGVIMTEEEIKKQPAKWVAANPDAAKQGIRSFWLNGFSSPWQSWETLILKFLKAKDDPRKLQVVYNTQFGELWEDRGETVKEDDIAGRAEEYEAELPKGVLFLSCGVDTQDNRLEYEVVGWGRYGESWGIQKGYIFGRPDSPDVWERLDHVIDKVYRFKNGRGLKISITCVDSGGHFTQEVYSACRERSRKNVFAIKGKGGNDQPFIKPPSKIALRFKKGAWCWLYVLGVDAGKAIIMSNLQAQEQGARYCHFPKDKDRGYDEAFYNGLLSEKEVRQGRIVKWVKLPGHERNEALDCRNYALAGLKIANPNFDVIEKRLFEVEENEIKAKAAAQAATPRRRKSKTFDEW